MTCPRLGVPCEDEGICPHKIVCASEFHCHMEESVGEKPWAIDRENALVRRVKALANACGEHNTALVSKTMWEKVAVALNETLDAALARVAELEVEVERMRERSAGAER